MAGVKLNQAALLIVDDERFTRDMVSQTLKRLGVREILHAENGQEAVDMLGTTAKNIHGMIIDFRMPVMHGLQLLKLIRMKKTAARANLPCAMFTGHAEKRLIGLAMALDVDDIMAKPVSLNTLETHIPRLIEANDPVKDPSEYASLDVDFPLAHLLDFEDAAPAGINAKTLRYLTPTGSAGGASGAAGGDVDLDMPSSLIPLSDVAKGMVLARNITGSDGVLLLGAGTLLSDRYINRLRDMGDVQEPVSHVWVFQK